MGLIIKVLKAILVIVLIITLWNQFGESKKLKVYLSDVYFRTLNELYYEADTIEHYILENKEYDINYLYRISGRLEKIYVELFNVYQETPITYKYYSNIFWALSGDINNLISSKTELTFIDSKFIEAKIITTCQKIKWSIEVIRQNVNKYNNEIGYYEELYFKNSITHEMIDEELKRYIKDI